MLLFGAPVVENTKNDLKIFFQNKKTSNKFVAILLLNDHQPSKVYVWLKNKFAKEIWLNFYIFGWYMENDLTNLKDEKLISMICWKYNDKDSIIDLISYLNTHNDCIGIVVQLPLPNDLQEYKSEILSAINFEKDPDWLNGVLLWKSAIDAIDFIPATPSASFELMKYYWIDDFKWKKVSVIWQSNLVWKPLVMQMIKYQAQVFSFNEFEDIDFIRKICKESDYIISATWVNHLIDESFVRDDNSQILIDIWWWIKEWKAVWDMKYELLQDKVKAITPVPWWIWPLTVACLFKNIRFLQEKHW